MFMRNVLVLLFSFVLFSCSSESDNEAKVPAPAPTPTSEQLSPQQLTAKPPKQWYGYTITAKGEIIAPDSNEAVSLLEGIPSVDIHSPSAKQSYSLVVFKQDDNGKQQQDMQDEPPVIIEIDDGDGNNEEVVTDCIVTDAKFRYGVLAHNPLRFPAAVTSPVPGGQNTRQTGPVDGPIPGQNRHILANAFEYHSDLNGIHGCTSEQGKKGELVATIKNNQVPGVTGLVGGSSGIGIANAFALDPGYTGSTRTGVRRAGGGTLYEGTRNVIHWLDAPNIISAPAPGWANQVMINLMLIMSVTKNSDGVTGIACISGHTHIIEYNANGAPSAMNPAQARQYLNGLQPNGAAPNEPAAQIQARRVATNMVKSPINRGGYQGQNNPEFRDLGCYSL